MTALLQTELDRQMEREIAQACVEGMRRYRECEWLQLPHCFDYGAECIFCGKTIEESKL
jgi:hypothetical protein